MRYRRADVTGGRYFFTMNLAERKRTLLVEHVDVVRSMLREVKARHLFHIDAMVILPDHLHAVWTLPVGDCGYPKRRMLIKAGFSRRISPGERRSKWQAGLAKRNRPIIIHRMEKRLRVHEYQRDAIRTSKKMRAKLPLAVWWIWRITDWRPNPDINLR